MDTRILVLIVASMLSQSKQFTNAKPHIMMIMVDDMGWNDVGFNGGAIETPNMDALAATGVILNNYYTAPNCGPSRAQFLTGKYLTHLGLQHKNLQPCRPRGIPLSERTVADELSALGYNSHLIGKWHGGFHTADYLPTNRGFDTFRGMLNGMGDHFTHMKGFRGGAYLDFYNDTTPNTDAYGVYSTDYFKQRALEVIDQHDKSGQPMFMFLSFQAPHTPNQAPQEFIDQYAHIEDETRRNYAAMVTAMDKAIGDIIVDLLKRNMYDNTVVVLSTDNGGQALNGGASNYPLRGNKGNYYEAGIKGVAVVASPLTQFVGVSDALFHITDWMPTFVHLAGGKSGGLDGVNQWDTLSLGENNSSRTEIIFNIDPLTLGDRQTSRALKRQFRGSRRGRTRPAATNPFALNRNIFNNAPTASIQPEAIIPRNTFVTEDFSNTNRPHFRVTETSTTSSTTSTTTTERPPFNTDQLAVIRSGDWKLMTGPVGFNAVIPNPDTDILGYLTVRNFKNHNSAIRLFNIRDDPTESNELSSSRPDIVNSLIGKLARHEETALPPFYPPQSPLCAPVPFGDIHVWGPFM